MAKATDAGGSDATPQHSAPDGRIHLPPPPLGLARLTLGQRLWLVLGCCLAFWTGHVWLAAISSADVQQLTGVVDDAGRLRMLSPRIIIDGRLPDRPPRARRPHDNAAPDTAAAPWRTFAGTAVKVTLTSAHGRKSAEEAQRNAGQPEEYSELIYNASDETAQASVRDLPRAAEQIGKLLETMTDVVSSTTSGAEPMIDKSLAIQPASSPIRLPAIARWIWPEVATCASSRAGSPHMGRFRLQSYLRDTGEVMFNLSVPIEVKSRYRGLFMGLPAATLGIE